MEKILTTADAVNICREIEPILAGIGYHCGLTGSTLYKGKSTKDIDIIIYPHQISKQLPMNEILEKIGATTNMYGTQGKKIPTKIKPSCTDKVIAVSNYKGLRVDFFFLT